MSGTTLNLIATYPQKTINKIIVINKTAPTKRGTGEFLDRKRGPTNTHKQGTGEFVDPNGGQTPNGGQVHKTQNNGGDR